jgi:hypothetical protein
MAPLCPCNLPNSHALKPAAMFRFGFADPASTQHAAEPGPAEQGQGAAAGAPVDTIGAEEVLDSEVRAMAHSGLGAGGQAVAVAAAGSTRRQATDHHWLLAADCCIL